MKKILGILKRVWILSFFRRLYVASRYFNKKYLDLVVNHFGTQTAWPKGGADRNKALFYEKWKYHLNKQREANA